MYYFIPKAANRPVFSYRLSIVHFWSLIFLYIWAGPAPPALHRAARLGAVARHGVLGDADRAVVGRHGQRPADAARRLGSRARGSGAEVHGRRRHRLRHVDVRRADDVAQERQRAHALHRLHHRPRASRRAGVERRPRVRDALLHRAAHLRHEALLGARSPTCTSGWRRSASSSTRSRCTSAASRRA